jgi:xanthine permease XanP
MLPKEKLHLGLEAAFVLAGLIALMVLGRASLGSHAPLPYLYEDTKQLVFLVQDAAHLIEKQGTAAFPTFAVRGSRWFDKWHYLFIYDLNGVCLFHPASPELIGRNLLVATLTLLLMVLINIRGRGKLKLYSVLIGLASGYLLSGAVGLLNAAQFNQVLSAPWVAIPYFKGMFTFDFQWSLLPTFAIVSITGALKSFGNLIMCEKVNDAEWREPDIRRISGGLLADSVCVTLSGLRGGLPSDTSASNVALSSASGATSRRIGVAAGALFIGLAFSPKIASLLSIMPTPVMGAILVFVICFMIMSGFQIILGSGVDQQKIFVIGLPLVFGLSLEILPALFAGVPYWLRPLVSSSLTLSTVLAVILNQLLRPKVAAPGQAGAS